jgi:RimJ/RimL family protein N-acetyltransferase
VAAEWPATLPDGTPLLVRRIAPEDAPALAEGFTRLSQESRRLRFLTPKPRLSTAELHYFTAVDGHRHEALVAVDPPTGEGVGVARFVRDESDPRRAEVAVTVADDWQQRGVATLLLDRLSDRAREEGVKRFTALVSADNRGMHRLLEHLGTPLHLHPMGGEAGEYEIELGGTGLGDQLLGALRAAASGRLEPPPSVLNALRALVPIRGEYLRRRPGR